MILAVLLAAKAAIMTPPTPCPAMTEKTISLIYVANDGSCSSYDDYPCRAGAVVQFFTMEGSSYAICGGQHFDWDFGDGAAAEVQNPKHIFGVAGTFPVYVTISNPSQTFRTVRTLVVRDAGTCASMTANNVFIGYAASDGSCVSSGSAPCNAHAVIQFLPLSINYNFACMTHRFHWEFGDGSTSDEPYPTHIFAGAGNEQVYLTIDNGEQTVRVMRDIVVRNTITTPPRSRAVRH